MKFTKITLSVALLGAFTLGMASNIDAQITKIQNAPAQERVELMNEFKQQLANMNKEDRMQAISQMQEKMHAHAQGHMQEAKGEREHMQGMGENTRQRAHDMAQGKQTEAMEHMNQMQHMNQRQAGDQIHQMDHMQGSNGGARIPDGGMIGGGMSGRDNH